MIHPLSDCKNNHIPESTNIWQYCVVLPDARIGENCNICSHCLIENKVKIGDNCTIKSGVQIWDGIELEDNVMIGANVSFTNDLYPRSKNKGGTSYKGMQRGIYWCRLHCFAWNNHWRVCDDWGGECCNQGYTRVHIMVW